MDDPFAMKDKSEVNLNISPRTGCIIAGVIGIILIALIWSVLLLAIRGEIRLQNADLTGFRFWLISTDGHNGLGFSRTRPKSNGEDLEGKHCIETKAYFFLFSSSIEEPTHAYCECYEDLGGQWKYVGACEP